MEIDSQLFIISYSADKIKNEMVILNNLKEEYNTKCSSDNESYINIRKFNLSTDIIIQNFKKIKELYTEIKKTKRLTLIQKNHLNNIYTELAKPYIEYFNTVTGYIEQVTNKITNSLVSLHNFKQDDINQMFQDRHINIYIYDSLDYQNLHDLTTIIETRNIIDTNICNSHKDLSEMFDNISEILVIPKEKTYSIDFNIMSKFGKKENTANIKTALNPNKETNKKTKKWKIIGGVIAVIVIAAVIVTLCLLL
jgi:hypothetical protein